MLYSVNGYLFHFSQINEHKGETIMLITEFINKNAFQKFEIDDNNQIINCIGDLKWYKNLPIHYRPGIEITQFARMTDEEIEYQYQRLYIKIEEIYDQREKLLNSKEYRESVIDKLMGYDSNNIATPNKYINFYFQSLIFSYLSALSSGRADLFIFTPDELNNNELLKTIIKKNSLEYDYLLMTGKVHKNTNYVFTEIYIDKTIALRDKAKDILDAIYPQCKYNTYSYKKYIHLKDNKTDNTRIVQTNRISDLFEFEADLIVKANLKLIKCCHCQNYYVPNSKSDQKYCNELLFEKESFIISTGGKRIKKPRYYKYCGSVEKQIQTVKIDFIEREIVFARKRIDRKSHTDEENDKWKKQLNVMKKKFMRKQISKDEMFGFLISDLNKGQRKKALSRYKEEFKKEFPEDCYLPYFFGDENRKE